MEWKTGVTELLGCKYPILQGAYGGIGNWKFASAVTKAGGHGIITASVSRTPERLREDINRFREATAGSDGSFGVNLSFGSCPRIEEMLEVCIEEGVQVETSVYKPDSLAPRIKESGVKWIHKSVRVKDAIHAEGLGADGIIMVGLEGYGRKNPLQLPTLVTTVLATRELKVPFIAAGGIGDARGFLGALGMGAGGIMMGTAFMATEECPVATRVKEAIVQAKPDDPALRNQVLNPPRLDPEVYKELMAMRDKVPLDKWLRMLGRADRGLSDWRSGEDYVRKPSELAAEPLKIMSLAVGVIDRITTVKGLIDSIISGAEELLDSYQFLKTR